MTDKTQISKPYLSQIESGKRMGTSEVLNRIASVLGTLIDDVID